MSILTSQSPKQTLEPLCSGAHLYYEETIWPHLQSEICDHILKTGILHTQFQLNRPCSLRGDVKHAVTLEKDGMKSPKLSMIRNQYAKTIYMIFHIHVHHTCFILIFIIIHAKMAW